MREKTNCDFFLQFIYKPILAQFMKELDIVVGKKRNASVWNFWKIYIDYMRTGSSMEIQRFLHQSQVKSKYIKIFSYMMDHVIIFFKKNMNRNNYKN